MNKQHRSLLLWFDRALSQNILRQIIILVIILTAVFIASFLLLLLSGSDWIKYCEMQHISKWIFPLYLLIDGNAFSNFYTHESVSEITVFLACLIYIAGVVIFTGMIISVMTNIIERRVEDHREGHIHYLQVGHYIIMGYDDMVPSFIKYVFKKDTDAYVLILTSVRAVDVTDKLRKSFTEDQMKHIIVNYGHRTTSESYKSINLESSKEIFIVGNHSQPAHDAINVECVDCICRYLESSKSGQYLSRITCVFKDLDTYAAFKTTEIFEKVRKQGVEFIPYNFFAGWAKQVFVKRSYLNTSNLEQKEVKYPAVFGNGITPEDPHFVHLVFVGTTNFAVAFAMEAAHILHFPNFNYDNQLKTRITFIDLNADKEKDEFITRNRHFFEIQSYRYQDLTNESSEMNIIEPESIFSTKNFLDIEFEFIKGNIFSKRLQDEIAGWANDGAHQYLSIFLAMENQRSNFVMGMNMPDEVYDNRIPIFIRQDRSDNFVTNLREADTRTLEYMRLRNDVLVPEERPARYAHIYPFGMNEVAYCADDKSIKRAKLINYLYTTADYFNHKFKSILYLETIPEKDLWEEADDMWNKLEVAYKWSNLYNSYAIRTKLATLRAMRGLCLDDFTKDTDPLSESEVKELAKVEHNRWNVEKLLMGYRKAHYDEDKYWTTNEEIQNKLKKNRKLFIHYDIRPFEELDDIKELDFEFSRYIPWIMKMTEK